MSNPIGRRLIYLAALVGLAVVPRVVMAEPFQWTFAALPSNISGPPGSTIGWGYEIENLDPNFWLNPTSLDAGGFQFASALNLFDFPVIPPGGSATESYDGDNLVGLYQLTWDPLAPLGFVNSGSFVATADFYTGDPLNGGVVIGQSTQRSADYSATVGSAAVPEPAPSLLAATGLALGGIWMGLRKIRSKTTIAQ